MKKICLVLIVLFLTHNPCVFAGETPQGFKEITAPELKNMIDEKKVVAVHVLSEIEYEMQHIEGSVNIPIIKMADTDKLPPEKETPLAFYCMGTR